MSYGYTDLKAELVADPLTRGYASMTDAQAAASLNAVNLAQTIDVDARAVRGTLYALGAWTGVQKAANAAAANADTSAAAIASQGLVKQADQGETIPMTTAAIAAQIEADLSAMVTAGIITADNKAAVLALSSQSVSRASQIGWPGGVSDLDVARARSL